MEAEDLILAYVQEHPGTSAKKAVSCLRSGPNDLIAGENARFQAAVFKQLRTLKKKGRLYNRGDRWYALKSRKD